MLTSSPGRTTCLPWLGLGPVFRRWCNHVVLPQWTSYLTPTWTPSTTCCCLAARSRSPPAVTGNHVMFMCGCSRCSCSAFGGWGGRVLMLLHPPASALEALSVSCGSPGTAAMLKACVGTSLRSCTLGGETPRPPSCPEVFSRRYCRTPPLLLVPFRQNLFSLPLFLMLQQQK